MNVSSSCFKKKTEENLVVIFSETHGSQASGRASDLKGIVPTVPKVLLGRLWGTRPTIWWHRKIIQLNWRCVWICWLSRCCFFRRRRTKKVERKWRNFRRECSKSYGCQCQCVGKSWSNSPLLCAVVQSDFFVSPPLCMFQQYSCVPSDAGCWRCG